MRRSEIQSLGSAIKDYLKESKFDGKIAEIDAVNLWKQLLESKSPGQHHQFI